MSDQYPSTLSIEIDRDRLRTYLRVKWYLCCAVPLSLFGGMFGLAAVFDKSVHRVATSGGATVLLAVKALGIGIGLALLIALFCYFIVSHRIASRFAATLEVTVEGTFLRIRQHTIVMSDRKLHFRSIVDYATTQDLLMRYFGIHALQMATTAGGQNATLIIPGVKDCLKVRDLLAEIDRQRENQ